MGLKEYNEKRKFESTPEPAGEVKKGKGPLRFCIQRHQASHLHYDLRLEMDGVLKSWAIPKGPTLYPKDKRLAMQTEDHPMKYIDFEGIIPKGNYGAGVMQVWDEGTYHAIDTDDPKESEQKLLAGLQSGQLKFVLHGRKMKGEFVLVHTKKEADNAWLLIKHRDEFATDEPYDSEEHLDSGTIIEKGGNRARAMELAEEKSREIIMPEGAVKKPFPKTFSPMLAKLIDEPFDDENWIFELKWDGYRAVAFIDPQTEPRLCSRNGNLFKEYSPINDDLQAFAHQAILDGEVVILNENGYSDFQRLQNITSLDKEDLRYYVFDILYLDGYDLTKVPLLKRKEILQDLLHTLKKTRYSDHIPQKGKAFYDLAGKKGLEGIIGKRANSKYYPGKRSADWVKIKIQRQQEAIICGYTAPKGSRQYFGSLVLGAYDEGQLKFIGSSGGGFSSQKLKYIYKRLQELTVDEPIFKQKLPRLRGITWVKPEMVCEIAFGEWTADGQMRHPVFLGLREDKKPEEVVIEKPESIVAVKAEAAKPVEKEWINREKKVKDRNTIIREVEGKTVKISNPKKIYWPDEGYKKLDLIDYYDAVAEYLVPHLKDRPQSLNRHPEGIKGDSFFHKNMGEKPLDWMTTVPVESDTSGEIHYLLCQDKADLLSMANLGCIEINPWSSRLGKLDYPDYTVIDLDPHGNPFEEVIETAQVVKDILDQAGVVSFPKTSGSKGIHIYIPLGAKYTYEQARMFAQVVASMAHRRLPKFTSIERSVDKRKKLLYIDYLQNIKGKTLACAYSVRPKPGATVSAPLRWEEVKEGLELSQFTIKTLPERVKEIGDLFIGTLGEGIDMKAAIERLSEQQA